MSPEAFVELLAKELGAAGVVAGANYRFGKLTAWRQRSPQRLSSIKQRASTVIVMVRREGTECATITPAGTAWEQLVPCDTGTTGSHLHLLMSLTAGAELCTGWSELPMLQLAPQPCNNGAPAVKYMFCVVCKGGGYVFPFHSHCSPGCVTCASLMCWAVSRTICCNLTLVFQSRACAGYTAALLAPAYRYPTLHCLHHCTAVLLTYRFHCCDMCLGVRVRALCTLCRPDPTSVCTKNYLLMLTRVDCTFIVCRLPRCW